MSILIIADSSLSQSEKEEHEVERLIDKKPAPSRKHKERRAPRHEQRRERMKVEDQDTSKTDPDMSLNYKSSSLVDMALKILIFSPSNNSRKDKVTQKTAKYLGIIQKDHP
jgi:hypothetical protein